MITIHEAKATDTTTLGLGALLPSKCLVREKAGGMYEMTLEHPMTEDMRHERIKPMRLIKAPAPVRETPLVEISQTGSVTREIYRVNTVDVRLNMRAGASTDSKVIHAYRPGTEVVKLGEDGDWMQVAILDGGATGWMWADYLEYVRTETEIISGDTPGGIVQPRQTREQLFRVYRYNPDTKTRTVYADARHITYDLAGAIIEGEYDPEGVAADVVCAQLIARADHDVSDFHIYCTVKDKISGSYGGRNIIDCLLDPETGVVAQTKARIVRDNYDIFILPDEARNRGVELRYGKNLVSASMDTDVSDIITRIRPVGKDADGNKLYIAGNNGYVDSPYINDYPVVLSKEVEYDVVVSDDLPIDDARALLKEKAEADFVAGCDMATVKLDADFVRLELTEDYRQLANAYALHMYDSVPVIDREADIVATARMVEYAYEATLDEYESTGLGELEEVKSTIYGYELVDKSIQGGKVIPNTLNGDRLQNFSVSYGKFDIAAIKQLSADAITAIRADIRELVAGNITTDQLYADLAYIAAAQITAANIDKANIQWAEIESLTAEIARIANAEIAKAEIDWAQIKNAQIDAADITNLTATVATIVKAEIAIAEIDWARIKNVEVDTAQIKLGAITQALIAAGAIGTAQIADGSITSAKIVELTADLIKTGTLSADRLLIKGAGGLFYQINATAGGLTASQLTEEQYKNAISGTALVAKSVTADKIAAKSITANEILSGTITAAEIDVSNLFAAEATINELNSYIIKASTIEALKGQLSLWADEKIEIAVGGIRIGATQLLKDTKRLTLGSASDADRWAVSSGVTVSDMSNGFAKATLTDSGQTADTWKVLRSPLTKLPDGWYGRQVTVSAWIYSDDWAGMDAGGQGPVTWTLALSQGGTDRLNYRGKYNIVKAGSVAIGADGASDAALENGKWVRVSTTYMLDTDGINAGTGTLADNTHVFMQFYLRRNGTYSIYAPKLEFGNVATDWSEHPEELIAGSSVRINEKEVSITTPKFDVNILSEDGETNMLTINEDGAVLQSATAPNITPRYDGPATLYVDPNATSAQIAEGNYYRSLADALAKINGRWISRSITINLAADMTEYGVLQVRGSAGNGTITINGNGAKLVGQMLIYLAGVPVTVDGLNVDVSANGYGFDVGNGTVYASIKNGVITGSGTGWGIKSAHGASVMVTGCELYDLTRSLYVQYGGRLHANGNQGNCVAAAAEGGFMTLTGTQPCHQTTWTAYKATGGQIFTENVTVDQGSKPTAEAEPTTVNYNFTYADSYAGGWSYFEDADVRQGYVNGRRIYGVIWFNAATIKTALTGKTIKQASLRLYMQSGVGRGVSVSVQMYGTSMAYDGRSGAPALTTTYGTIGSTTPGEVNTITIPTQVIADIVSGKIQALVLYSDDTDYYSGRSYSKNYARFDGSTSGSSSTRPMLTVMYS